MPNEYTMNDAMQVAEQGTQDITAWLEQQEQVLRIENVENNPDFQNIDVDLIVHLIDGTQQKIEIKADRYHRTGNFFFETISNLERNTLGCFMYTEADELFYYFPEIRKLYSLKMPELRTWFENNQHRFPKRTVQTPIGNGQRYTTVGRLVPIRTVLQECRNLIKQFDLNE